MHDNQIVDRLVSEISERAKNKGRLRKKVPADREVGLKSDDPVSQISSMKNSTSKISENNVDSQADIAILVALSAELKFALQVFSEKWTKELRDGIMFNVAQVKFGEHEVRVVVAVQNEMGMVNAAIFATKAIKAWRPLIICMCGICAGVKGKVKLGDIVIAKRLFDYGSGKTKEGHFTPDYQPVQLDDELCTCAMSLADDTTLLSKIRNSWPSEAQKPDTELRAHVGCLASGSAVIEDASLVESIQKHNRTLTAIDMEAYGVARAAACSTVPFVAIKGVQDFADKDKCDDYRQYAAFVSAKFLHHFFAQHWAAIAVRHRNASA